MKNEFFKADNTEEIVWLRLNRLKTVALCRKLIEQKLEQKPNLQFNNNILEKKAVGLSSAIKSAIGYWETETHALNAKILMRYYFLLQMTIAEQVSSTGNLEGLADIQKHTEMGHGLATISKPNGKFPNDFFVYPIQSGHFYTYAKGINLEIKDASYSKRQHKFEEIVDVKKLVSLTDLLRRVPELNTVIEEYLDIAPLSFHIGHAEKNLFADSDKIDAHYKKTGEILHKPPIESEEKVTFIAFYSDSSKVTPEYLRQLPFPTFDYEEYKSRNESYIIGKLKHPHNKYWFEHFKSYSSSYATSSYTVPLWSNEYNSIAVNYAVLYSLSIIVRYLPDLWHRVTKGDLEHIGSLIEYYISVMDHVLPHQMLERITGNSISIQNPGSIFGQI